MILLFLVFFQITILFLLTSNSPAPQPNLAHMASREKLPEEVITKGWGMLRCLDHAINQEGCGTCAAFNTTSSAEVQLQDQNPLTKSLHTWSWVNSTSMHCTQWSFPVWCDAQKPCATNNPSGRALGTRPTDPDPSSYLSHPDAPCWAPTPCPWFCCPSGALQSG